MPKRNRDIDHLSLDKKSRKKNIKFQKTPPINSINDLIKIGRNQNKFYKNIDMEMLYNITPYLEELDNLIGMNSLKISLFYQIIYYIQGMHIRNKQDEYLHTLLIGPPGSGKTTVAHIISKIYQGLGILSKNGPFIIAHRDDFIAGFLGQTALKTQKLLNSCIGGILFIDEVYALGPSQLDKDSFSKEAIDTLCSFLSEHTNDFCCIAAGYEKDIKKCFLSVNAGLESRFQWKHKIEEYTLNQLAEIFIKKVNDINWNISIDKIIVADVIKNHKDMFKNAGRDILNFITKCKMSHSHRILSKDKIHKFILTREDLENGLEMMKNSKIDDQKIPPPPLGMYI